MEGNVGYDPKKSIQKGLLDLVQSLVVVVAVAAGGYLMDVDVVKHFLTQAHVSDVAAGVIALVLKSVGQGLLNWSKNRDIAPNRRASDTFAPPAQS